MTAVDDTPRTASGFTTLGDALWALVGEMLHADPALLQALKAESAERAARIAAGEFVPGPASDHLHDGSEMHPGDVGYRCLVCRDAGFVRREVPVGHADFGKAHKCRCNIENDATRQARATVRMQRSGLPDELLRCTLDAFQARQGAVGGRRAVEQWIEALRTGAERPRWLALFGAPGVGKTHLLAAATQAAAPFAEVAFAKQWEFLRDCKANHLEHDEALTARAVQVPVLVFDGIGGTSEKEWGTDKIERILMHRYEQRAWTVLALEVNPPELKVWSPRLASRLSDRDLCLSIALTGGDYRGQKGATDVG